MKSVFLRLICILLFNVLVFAQQKKHGCVSGNCENGIGKYLFASGDIYEGPFQNGKQEGDGTYTNADGTYSIGYWHNGLRDGAFASTDNSGRGFFCMYSNGKKHGYSHIEDKDGNIISEQEWVNGSLKKVKLKKGQDSIIFYQNSKDEYQIPKTKSIKEKKPILNSQPESTKTLKTNIVNVVQTNPANKKQHKTTKSTFPEGYSSADAAAFTKDFGRQFMGTDAWIGNFRNYILEINNIDVITNPKESYVVNISISWNEVEGFTNLAYQYKGVLIFDKHGCKPMFLISERKEPSFLGTGVRSYEMDEKNKNILNEVCPGVKWYRALLNGCLEK